ncbi:MAG: B12-binding domain-containing radical SAM protein [Firmicutes bacterium]|nr:B12-binding domain-containing radical SAM protein [Bacillota bacterium]
MKADDILKKMRTDREKEKIDILLVHCDLYYEIDFSSPNMGLAYIATYLSSQGYSCEILSAPMMMKMDNTRLKNYIRKKNPRFVGFYLISDNLEITLDTAGLMRKKLPDTVFIAGGPLAAAMGETLLDDTVFDYVITGEGEFALKYLCDYIRGEAVKPDDIPGLIYKCDGKVKYGAPVSPVKDLDSLPFPDLKFMPGQQVFQIVSGRGCPYPCTFCFQAGHGLKFRFRSAANVAEEIIHNFETSAAVGFDFIDDAFIMDAGRCLEISEKLAEYRQKSRRDFIFFCQGRVNILDKHPELIPALDKAGLAKMQIGIESGDPETLKLYRKQITVDQVRKAVKNIRDNSGFMIVGGFILGGPFENEKTFANTVNLAVELIGEAPGVFETSAGFLGAYPGTEIALHPERFGLKVEEPDFIKGLSLGDVQMSTEAFDKNSIRRLENRFYEAVLAAMEKNLKNIPAAIVKNHFIWAERYRMFSVWYLFFLSKFKVMSNYFKFLESPRFATLSEIPPENIGNWRAVRVIEKRNYRADGNILLPASIIETKLDAPEEILIYELCSGKLTIKQAVDRYCKEKGIPGEDKNEVFHRVFLPTLKKLETGYQVVFHQ